MKLHLMLRRGNQLSDTRVKHAMIACGHEGQMVMLGQDLNAHQTYGLSVTVTLFGAVMSQKVWWPRDGSVLLGASLDDAIPTLSGGPLARVRWSGRHCVHLEGIEEGVEDQVLEPDAGWRWDNGQGVEAKLELVPRQRGHHRHRQFQGDAGLLLMMLMLLVGVGQFRYLWNSLTPAHHTPVLIEQAPERVVVMQLPVPVTERTPVQPDQDGSDEHPGQRRPQMRPGVATTVVAVAAAEQSKRLFEGQGLVYTQTEPFQQAQRPGNNGPADQKLFTDGSDSIHRSAVRMAKLGQLEEALSLLARHSVRDPSDPYLALTRAKIYAIMGKKARSYRLIRRALRHVAARAVSLQQRIQDDLSSDTAFDEMRRERRFQRLRSRGEAHG